ncbi:MAG: glycosyltransferase family 4 protein [Alphaproteobacteria bacterium]|nr:glycosyltransferase family 4 protein [Alphaproteobacteria bacterium]
MTDGLIIILSLAITTALTALVKRILIKRALLDHPNERSSHTMPVPRGGGWALMAVLIPGMLLTSTRLPAHTGLIAGVILLCFISWLDDRKGVNPLLRLGIHIFVVCLAALFAFKLPYTIFPFIGVTPTMLFGNALPFWLDRAIMIIGWAWFINLYNFMDGIDGITSVETISIATGACLVMTAANIHDPFVSTFTLLLTGACLGFLVFNWHPARIFLGDVGSVPLGFLTGFVLLTVAMQGHIIPALILPLYYLADSGITIAKRALRGEKIWQAHRQHFYQHATQGAGRHDKVVYWIIAANIGLIGAALAAIIYPWSGLAAALLIVAILLYKMHKTGIARG